MRRPYASLVTARVVGDSPTWYWRVLAYVSSWSLLSGYLILPTLFDTDPQLRIPSLVLTIIAVALLTLGVSVSVLLFFAVPDLLFRRDALLIPCFSASFLGLLTLVFHFVVSVRYAWTAAAIAGTVVSVIASVCYALLALWVNSELAVTKHRRDTSISHMPLRAAEDTSYSASDTFLAPLAAQPADSAPGIYVYPNGQAVQAMPMHPVGFIDETDEERTRQQMLSLLLRTADAGRGRSTSTSSTYHIDLPQRQLTQDEHDLLKNKVAAGKPRRVWVENPLARSEVLAPLSASPSAVPLTQWDPPQKSPFHDSNRVPQPETSKRPPHNRENSWETIPEPPPVLVTSPTAVQRTSSPSRASQPRRSSNPRSSASHSRSPSADALSGDALSGDDFDADPDGDATEPMTLLPAARYVPKTTAAKRERRRVEIEEGRRKDGRTLS